MAKATASPPARRRSGDRPRGKAKTPKHKTKETSPPKHESAWKHEINRGFIAPFLLTRWVHFHAAIWHNLSPPLTLISALRYLFRIGAITDFESPCTTRLGRRSRRHPPSSLYFGATRAQLVSPRRILLP